MRCQLGYVVWPLGQKGPPGEGNGYPLQCSCLADPHGQRSLVGYSPWGRKELDMTKRLTLWDMWKGIQFFKILLRMSLKGHYWVIRSYSWVALQKYVSLKTSSCYKHSLDFMGLVDSPVRGPGSFGFVVNWGFILSFLSLWKLFSF